MNKLLKNNICTHNVIPSSCPCATLPGRSESPPVPLSHTATPILHFLWSILESIQEEKHMHARRTHAHNYTTHSLSRSLSYTNAHRHTSKCKRAGKNKVTCKTKCLIVQNRK